MQVKKTELAKLSEALEILKKHYDSFWAADDVFYVTGKIKNAASMPLQDVRSLKKLGFMVHREKSEGRCPDGWRCYY